MLYIIKYQERNIVTNEEKIKLIEKTIKEVEGTFAISRLIQDCSDKLSLSFEEVKELLESKDSELLKRKKKP